MARESSIDVRVGKMTYADFVIEYPSDSGNKSMGIERKEVSDFLGSFASGRLQKQLDGIKGTYDKAALLVEGDFDWGKSSDGKWRVTIGNKTHDWSFLSVQNYLVSVAMAGVVVIRTRSEQETVTQVAGLHQYLYRHQDNVSVLPVAPRDKKLRHDVACLTMIPGVGPKTASALIEKLGSIAGIILATDEEVRSVKGVGDLTLRNIRLVLGTGRVKEATSVAS